MSAPLRLRWRAAVLDRESGLTWRGRLLGCVLVEHANNASAALDPAPSPVTLAAEMGASEASVHRGRRELEAAGLLEVTRRSGQPSRMRLCLTREPLSERQGSATATPVQTPVSTSVSQTPEQGEPGEPVRPSGVRGDAQRLVAYFVDSSRELGSNPPRQVVGQVARQLGALVREDYSEQTLEAALGLMLARRLHPSTLPTLILEAQAGPFERRRAPDEHAIDRRHRETREAIEAQRPAEVTAFESLDSNHDRPALLPAEDARP